MPPRADIGVEASEQAGARRARSRVRPSNCVAATAWGARAGPWWGACVGATSLLSKRCLCSRETEGTLRPGQQRPPWLPAAHLGLLLELGHVQEHLCDLPVEHAHTVPVQEEGAVLINIHLQEGAGAEAGAVPTRPGWKGSWPELCRGAAQPLPEHRLLWQKPPAETREAVSGQEPSAKADVHRGVAAPPPQGTPGPRGLQQPHVILRPYENLPSILLGKRVPRLFRSWKASDPWPSVQSLDPTAPAAT